MANIRATLELLVRILKENGTFKIKAETFRQSKFNEDGAVAPLWKLLFELIFFCDYGTIDDTTTKAVENFSNEELVVYVKKSLQKRGFFSQDFAALPNDQSTGSREILLAVGWLLCKENIINQFMVARTSPLDNDTYRMHEGEEQESGSMVFTQSSKDPVQKVQQLLFLNNKLRLNLRSMYALQCEKNSLTHKIHDNTKGVNLWPDTTHLSMLEVFMLRHPDMLDKNLQLLEKDNTRLQNLLKWRDCEDIFWKWMESVLDVKLQSKNELGHSSESKKIIPPLNLGALKTTHNTLKEAILKYEGIVDRLEMLLECKSTEVTEEELEAIISAIDLELSVQRASISLYGGPGKTESWPDQNKDVIFRYKKQSDPKRNVRHATKNITSSSSSVIVNNVRDIQEEIQRMESTLKKMQSEVFVKKDTFQREMEEISENFTDVICIPAMTQKLK